MHLLGHLHGTPTSKLIQKQNITETLHMLRKFRFGFSVKINLGEMSDKKSLSIQVEEILIEQIRTYPYLYDGSKKLCKERNINRNTWSKVAENLDLIHNIYKFRHEKLSYYCTSPVANNRRVRANLSVTEIHFLKRVSFFKMNLATISRRCSNRSGDIRNNLKIKEEKYLLYQLRTKN